MKPVKMDFIEWYSLKRQKSNKAITLAAAQVGMTVENFLDYGNGILIVSDSSKPCIYNSGYEGTEAFGKAIKIRKLPKNFHIHYKNPFDSITHISPLGCPNLNTKVTVECFAGTKRGYFYCTHKVGKCPWKRSG